MTEAASPLDRSKVANALWALIKRTNEDSFVIVAERNTGKYVQFACDVENLTLDLPTNLLNHMEVARAAIYFFETHGTRPEVMQLVDANGNPVPWDGFVTFTLELAGNVQVATKIVFEIFDQVYQLAGPIDLIITEN
jgi:hypothetical protein